MDRWSGQVSFLSHQISKFYNAFFSESGCGRNTFSVKTELEDQRIKQYINSMF